VVKQISGRTALEWIENYVTMELRVALKNSARSIKEIAEDMNFPNQSFLGKYFKEHVGMTPSEYRKS
jgi:AraC-like DNA-binding protein